MKKVIIITTTDETVNFDELYFSVLESLLENGIPCIISDGEKTNIISVVDVPSCPSFHVVSNGGIV